MCDWSFRKVTVFKFCHRLSSALQRWRGIGVMKWRNLLPKNILILCIIQDPQPNVNGIVVGSIIVYHFSTVLPVRHAVRPTRTISSSSSPDTGEKQIQEYLKKTRSVFVWCSILRCEIVLRLFFRLRQKVKKHNLVVASYDIVRNDSDFFKYVDGI